MRQINSSETGLPSAAPCPLPKPGKNKKAGSSAAGMKNKYSSRSRISEAKVRQIVKLFALDLNALQIASLAGVNRNTVNRYLAAFRERIARFCEEESPISPIKGINLNACIPGEAVNGKAGNETNEGNTNRKGILFGLFHRNGCVYTEIVPDDSKATPQGIIKGRIAPENVINTAGWRGYDSLVDLNKQKYIRIACSQTETGKKRPSANGMESFWAYTKTRLLQFRGIQKKSFYFHLKECEFRFNHRNEDIYSLVLKMLRDKPLASTPFDAES